MLTLSALILLTGVFPQPGVTTRERAAREILEDRASTRPNQRPEKHGRSLWSFPDRDPLASGEGCT